MATLDPDVSAPPISCPPASIQPGGGFCMRLELAWGRLRRAWLRRCRPAYVRRLAQKRQGHCPDCPHDIIDARDLKFFRNVCGYWFKPDDDPFAWRGRLGLARAGLAEIVCFSLVFLTIGLLLAAVAFWVHPWFWASVPVLLFLWFQTVYFFRDPERRIPTDPDVLLSPADGTVTHVEEVNDGDFPDGRALRISIFLSVFNVHVNRSPCTGRVVAVRYFQGSFLDARNAESAVRNEQLWVDLNERDAHRLVRVKQISGAIARRIVCWLRAEEEVRAGDRFGMIKFGSRTDVLLPAGDAAAVCVRKGDKVQGGSTILLRLQPRQEMKVQATLTR
jgi:phosphatidylserine decarboxylase